MEFYKEKKNNKELSEDEIKIINFIMPYLEKKYSIKKRNKFYIIKNTSQKIVLHESNILSSVIKYDATNLKNNIIYYFLLKSLQNKWKIEKKQNKFILIKKHEGKKEYFSSNYLLRFMETHF
jgi:hypothetical protein